MKLNVIGAGVLTTLCLAACGQPGTVPSADFGPSAGSGPASAADPLAAQALPPLPSGALACFYVDINYQGASFCASASSSWVGRRFNDRISSYRLAPGYNILLYRDINYGGGFISTDADVTNLASLGFNDVASSFKVQPNGVPAR